MSSSEIVVAVCTFLGAAFWFAVVLVLSAHSPGKADDIPTPSTTVIKRPVRLPTARPTTKAGRRAAPTGTWC